MKPFLNRESNCFAYLCETFPALSTEQLRAEIFYGSQIRRLIQNKNFSLTMTTLVKMLGGHLQQLSKTSLDILKLLTITTFQNSC